MTGKAVNKQLSESLMYMLCAKLKKEVMMNRNTNERIERFMQDALFVDEEKGKILVSLRKIILKISPDAQEEIKYNGLVFNVNTKLICGIFIRKNHISLEFSFGMMISDPDKYLEGNGKYRRHLKIFNKKDLRNKKVESYVSQAFNFKY
ncbi:DUF1801 domain-containing protein [bacterium]|nr:DUF1801 domain-containing protein [bacterium]